MKALDAAGVRGVRFNFVKRLVDAKPRETTIAIAERIAELGWHIVIYFEAHDLAELCDLFINALPTTIVVDHMGRPDVDARPSTARLRAVRRVDGREPAERLGKVTCPERLVESGPPGYDDFVPFARRAGRRRSPTGCCGAPTGRTPT